MRTSAAALLFTGYKTLKSWFKVIGVSAIGVLSEWKFSLLAKRFGVDFKWFIFIIYRIGLKLIIYSLVWNGAFYRKKKLHIQNATLYTNSIG